MLSTLGGIVFLLHLDLRVDCAKLPEPATSADALTTSSTAQDGGGMCSACIPFGGSSQSMLPSMLVTGSKLNEWRMVEGCPRPGQSFLDTGWWRRGAEVWRNGINFGVLADGVESVGTFGGRRVYFVVTAICGHGREPGRSCHTILRGITVLFLYGVPPPGYPPPMVFTRPTPPTCSPSSKGVEPPSSPRPPFPPLHTGTPPSPFSAAGTRTARSPRAPR